MYIKLDKEYEVKTTLGTIREIEKAFGKSFFDTVASVGTMRLDEQIKLLYVGVKRANLDLTQEQFTNLCEEYLGIGDIMEYLEQYFYALQYPGLSQIEVQERIQKKSQQGKIA